MGIGVAATIAAVIAAPFTCGASSAAAIGTTLFKIALGMVVGATMSLAIGGTIAGIQSAMTGHGFWEGFADSVTENFVDALVTSFAILVVTVAAGNFIKHGQCFKEGTLVETEDGLKPIEEIQEGDLVLSYDEETGEQAYKEVVRLFRNETEEWYHIKVNGEKIVCTGGHPFYVLNAEESRKTVLYEGTKNDTIGKWITAKELKVFDKLLLSDGTCAIIEEIQLEQLSQPETIYNFEVADFHTYYVSESNILVHNTCPKHRSKPRMANRGSTGRTEANNLVEKLAMEQVKTDPLNGSQVLESITLGDTRWAASDGWVKMQSIVNSGSHRTVIHFVYNNFLNLVDDFKFVGFITLL